MLIRDIAAIAAEIVGDGVLLDSLDGGSDEGAGVKLMLTSVCSALPRVAADFPAPESASAIAARWSELDGVVDCTSADAYTAAYLAARNYCLFNGHTDEASYFEQLYDEAAERNRLKRRASLPPPKRLV